ncbi:MULTISPECIES: hypothetical protein [Levilactobacillus]|uniref:hypothetical protein n=1 Tax=Levilactobacillus TaxID=2767886 RepID=UPI0013DE1FA5|nr:MULTISPECIES: hypothetical protein [Levilactobacillus]
MTRQEKIEMVAGTSNHPAKFIEELTADNDQLLENLVVVAKAQIANETADQVFEAMA